MRLKADEPLGDASHLGGRRGHLDTASVDAGEIRAATAPTSTDSRARTRREALPARWSMVQLLRRDSPMSTSVTSASRITGIPGLNDGLSEGYALLICPMRAKLLKGITIFAAGFQLAHTA